MVETGEKREKFPDYEVVVKLKDGIYYCRIPELMQVANGNDLELVYQELMCKKEEFFKEAEQSETEVDDLIPASSTWYKESKSPGGHQWKGNDIKYFIIKMGIVVLAAMIILTYTGRYAGSTMDRIIDSNVNNVRRQVKSSVTMVRSEIKKLLQESIPSHPGRNLEKALYEAADHPIDPKRQEKIIKSIRKVVKKLSPFAKEFRPLITEDTGLDAKHDKSYIE